MTRGEVLDLNCHGYSQHKAYPMAFLPQIPINIKRCLFEDILRTFTPVFAPWPTHRGQSNNVGLPPTLQLVAVTTLGFYLAGLCVPSQSCRFSDSCPGKHKCGQPQTCSQQALSQLWQIMASPNFRPALECLLVTTGKWAANKFFFLHHFLSGRASRY